MSDYFVWETRRRDSEALIAGFPPTPQDYGVSFFVGRRFLVDLPELELVMDRTATGTLTDDLVVAKQRCIAHSNRLQRVLRAAGVDGIDYYPVRIVNPITSDVYHSHEAANILEVIHCLDREGSDPISMTRTRRTCVINRLALVQDRLGDALLFRLGERPRTVIVRARSKRQSKGQALPARCSCRSRATANITALPSTIRAT